MNRLNTLLFSAILISNVLAEELTDIQISSPVMDKATISNEAIEEILQFVRSVNRYFEHKAPWKLMKENLKSAGVVLYTGAEALRICAVLLSPIMPKRMKLLLSILNAESYDRSWGSLRAGELMGEHKPLFPRITSENIL